MKTYVIVNSNGEFFSSKSFSGLNSAKISFSPEYPDARVYSTGSYWPMQTAKALQVFGHECKVIQDYGLDTQTVLD